MSDLNALGNAEVPAVYRGMPKEKREAHAKELLLNLGLGDRIQHHPNQLSGGQQQRVAIARALINNPWILIADEPTGSLDSKTANDVMDLLDKLNKKSKRTVIVVTHNPDYLRYADTIYHLIDGKVDRVEHRRKVSHEIDEKEHEEIKI